MLRIGSQFHGGEILIHLYLGVYEFRTFSCMVLGQITSVELAQIKLRGPIVFCSECENDNSFAVGSFIGIHNHVELRDFPQCLEQLVYESAKSVCSHTTIDMSSNVPPKQHAPHGQCCFVAYCSALHCPINFLVLMRDGFGIEIHPCEATSVEGAVLLHCELPMG